MHTRLSDRAQDHLVRLQKEALAARTGRRRPPLRAFLLAAQPIIARLAHAIELRIAQEPPGLVPDRAARLAGGVVDALKRHAAGVPELDALLRGRWRMLRDLASLLADALVSTAPSTGILVEFKTPRTRLRWRTLGEWLRAYRAINRRPPSSAKNNAETAHLSALTQAVVNTGTREELDALRGLGRFLVAPIWKEWIHLAEQGYSGRVRKLARALELAAEEHGIPSSWGCMELQKFGFPSPTAAGRLGRKKLHEVQELVGEKFHVGYDSERCRFTLSRAGVADG